MPFPFSVLLDCYYYMPDILESKKNAQFTFLGNNSSFSYKTPVVLAEDRRVGSNKYMGQSRGDSWNYVRAMWEKVGFPV